MSKKLEIMKQMTLLLEETPGYDLTGKVFRGRKFISVVDLDGLGEALSILEASRPTLGETAGGGQVAKHDWTLNVQGWPTDDRINPSDPAYLLADAVEKQLQKVIARKKATDAFGDGGGPVYPEWYLLGGRITNIQIANAVVLPAQENLSKYAFFYIPVVLTIIKGS